MLACLLTHPLAFSHTYSYSRLGAGSFGQVWLASAPPKQDEGTRPTYALKVQSKYQLMKTCQAESVVSEKNIMASLCSDFILQLVNTYQDEQRVYMLTGLLQGGELATVLYNAEYTGIGEDNAKFYAAGILEGLTFMHQRKIIHRDIKPQVMPGLFNPYNAIAYLQFVYPHFVFSLLRRRL